MKLTAKSQVTIPKRIRDRFGLRPGSRVRFIEKNHQIVLEKEQVGDVWDKYYGFLKIKKSTNEIFRELRGRDLRP